jgi:hypothetical protein
MDIDLKTHSLYRLPDAAGVRIACRTGSVWITLDDDPRDIVLEAGSSFTTDEHRRALVFAFEGSSLSLEDVPSGVRASPTGWMPRHA